MISNEEVTIFLEHYGVKGMHWGVRNDPKPMNQKPSGFTRNEKIMLGGSVVLGTIVATQLLTKHRGLKVASLHTTSTKTRALMKEHVRLSDLSDSTQIFMKEFSAKQASLTKSANEDLKNLYKMNETPIAIREYLKGL